MFDIKIELKKLGIDYSIKDRESLKILCPFHDDGNPSCAVNFKKQVFKCFACNTTGTTYKLLAKLASEPEYITRERLSQKYADDSKNYIEPTVVEEAHELLLSSGKLMLNELHGRAVSDEIIRQYRLGLDSDGRISIPIKNWEGIYVNRRSYKPGAKKFKFLNIKGMSANRLYPMDQLRFDTIILCGGEVKALAAISKMLGSKETRGVGALACTGGECNWDADFNYHFEGKRVYVCLDIDDAGQKATAKLCQSIFTVVDELYVIQLPLDIKDYPRGDLNDYLAESGSDLQLLMDKAIPYAGIMAEPKPAVMAASDISMSDVVSGSNVGERLRFKCRATGISDRSGSHIVPRSIRVECERDRPYCNSCEVWKMKTDLIKVDKEDPLQLSTIKATKRGRDAALREICGIPTACKVCRLHEIGANILQAIRMSSDLDVTNAGTAAEPISVLYVADQPDLKLNESYECTGKLVSDPETQQIKFMASGLEQVEDSLDSFELDDPETLKIFQPKEWTVAGIEDKLKEIYDDFAANVTGIKERQDFHLLCDLTYHSVLHSPVKQTSSRGWVETLVIGDTGQGKSELTQRLISHYGLGESVDCKSATVAGMLGGLEKYHDQFYVTWGFLPMNDRRLLVMEEVKGMRPEVMSALTDVRSSGLATIPKIQKHETFSRTRLIVVSNPKSDQPLSAYAQGVMAIPELMINREDIRRFDACMILQAGEANRHFELNCEHTHSKKLCRDLILWSWTRKTENITIEDPSELLEHSKKLENEFTTHIPLMEDIHSKLIRLSSALACRTFSINGTPDGLMVTKAHVEYIVKYLRRIYNSDAFGFSEYTKSQCRKLVNPDEVKELIRSLHSPEMGRTYLLGQQELTSNDMLVIAPDMMRATNLWSRLVQNKAIIKSNGKFYKTPEFVVLLKTVDCSKPEYVEERDDAF